MNSEEKVEIHIFEGNDAKPYLSLLADLRLEVFKEPPYLYLGNKEDELHYGARYLSKNLIISITTINGRFAAIGTGLPLVEAQEVIRDVREKLNDLESIYYYGEVIVLSEFRGKGLLKKILATQDEYIKTKGFTKVSMMTVIRDSVESELGEKLGYTKTEMTIRCPWLTIQPDGSAKKEVNQLLFWIKSL